MSFCIFNVAKEPTTSKKVSSADPSLLSPAKEVKSSKEKPTCDDFGDDVLDEFLKSNIKKKDSSNVKLTSPVKHKSKDNSFQDEDDDLLDDLSLSQFSPSKDNKIKSTHKTSNSLGDLSNKSSSSKGNEERRGSYFDDFLQKLSPKHGSSLPTTPDIPEENLKNNDGKVFK